MTIPTAPLSSNPTKPIKVDEFLDTLDVALKFSKTQAARPSKEATA